MLLLLLLHLSSSSATLETKDFHIAYIMKRDATMRISPMLLFS